MRSVLRAPSNTLCIVVPAYNESNRIGTMLHDYCEHFRGRARILVVVNGCSDDTYDVVCRLTNRFANLQAINITAKVGKGGAIRLGLMTATEEFVGFSDADGSTSAAEFDRMFGLMGNSDCVIGSRWSPASIVSPAQPLKRRVASRAFNFVVQCLFGLRLSDTQCGAKIFRSDTIAPLLDRLELANFAFDIDILSSLAREHHSILEVPIQWSDVSNGTKINLIRASISMLAAILRLRLRDSTFQVPYIEYFTRRSVIPVRRELSLLVFSGEHPEDPYASAATVAMRAYLDHWAGLGHRATWIVRGHYRPKRPGVASPFVVYVVGEFLGRLKTFLWYVFSSRRDYDALFEVANPKPFFVPAFSIKKTFVIRGDDGDLAPFARAVYRYVYRRSQVVRHDVSDAISEALLAEPGDTGADSNQAQAQALIADLYHAHPHSATFVKLEDSWSIHYTDSDGKRREHFVR